MVDAVRARDVGMSILAAFGRFVLDQHGLLAKPDAGERLCAITRTIVASPTLLAHEQQVFARFTGSLAAAIADETGAHPPDVTPWVVANALIGIHRSLIVGGGGGDRRPRRARADFWI